MTDWTGLTIHETVKALRAGRVTARALVDAYLGRITRLNETLGAYLTVATASARAQADAVDERFRRGDPLRPLEGVPLAIKDVLCTRGLRTTCGSRILEGFVPPYDATAVVRLVGDGAIVLGKTNCDEFAMGSSTENSGFHVTRNPWGLDRVPGGSSGGSAAAVAADLAAGGLGTDTGGLGAAARRPLRGRRAQADLRSRLALRADRVRLVARPGGTARQGRPRRRAPARAIAGADPLDSTAASEPVGDYQGALSQGVEGLTLGIPDEYFVAGLDPEVEHAVREAIRVLERSGARTRRVSLPHTDAGVATYYIVAPAEASSNLARYDGVKYGLRVADGRDLVSMTAAHARGGLRPRGAAPHHAGHLRAVGRLLRRLLRARPSASAR